MTPPHSTTPGTIIQSWVPVALATRLRAHAQRQGRSVSSTIRVAVETVLEASPDPGGEDADAAAPGRRTVAGQAPATEVRMGDGEVSRTSSGRSTPRLATPETTTEGNA